MATFEVELEAMAYLRTLVEVEAESREAAYQEVSSWDVKELYPQFEGEKFYLTGDTEVLSIDGEEVL